MSHTMLVDEGSTDLDALRDDLRFELIVLHGEVKELNKSWDFSAIVNPLLEDQGAPIAVIARLKKQIKRLKKLRDDFQQKARELQRPAAALAQVAQSLHVAEFPVRYTEECRPVKQRPQQRRHPEIVVEEVTPSWGDCPRYSHSMTRTHYESLVAIARQIYDMILQFPDPHKFPQKHLHEKLLSAITNKWLVFQNIKDAAINRAVWTNRRC